MQRKSGRFNVIFTIVLGFEWKMASALALQNLKKIGKLIIDGEIAKKHAILVDYF